MKTVSQLISPTTSAALVSARSRGANVSLLVEEICEHAFQFGLDSGELRRVVKLVSAKSELDQTSITTLIKNLYPTERVSSEVVATVVASLGRGQRKPSPASQAALVRWLGAVHEVLETPGFLSRLYGVLFNLLDMMTLRQVHMQ